MPSSPLVPSRGYPRRVLTPPVRALPELLAGLLAALVFCLAGIVRGTYPFGTATRSSGDLGVQFVPLHARLRDLLTGQADGDLFLNWSSGLGVPFLPDYVTYLASPLAPLVLLFPRDQVDLAVFVLTTLKLALAAGLMTAYLRRISPGPWPAAAALGAAYGVCGWAIDDASYVPMWLDGFAGLPLLALAGESVIRRERFVLPALAVALVWLANFYIAIMATLGVAVLLLVRLAALRLPTEVVLRALLRLAATIVVGIALTAPLLVPTYRAVLLAEPSPPATFDPAGWPDVLVRFLPLTEGVGLSPSVYVVTPVLLLALALPWVRRVPARTRVAHVVALVLVLLSMQWGPTHALWHGFDIPNGSPYRQAFVVSALVVVMAWVALGPGPPQHLPVLGATVTLVAIAALAVPSDLSTAGTWPALVVSTAVTAAVLLLVAARWPLVLGAALVLAVLVEGTATAVVTDALRRPKLATYPYWGAQHDALRENVLAAQDWPRVRTSPSANERPNNDPMLIGGQGLAYYSSTMPQATTDALFPLGVTWFGWGRSVLDRPDPGLSPLLSIGARAVAGGQGGSELLQGRAVPLVTLREQPVPPPAGAGRNPFTARNRLWGAELYEVPAVEVALPAGATAEPRHRSQAITGAEQDPVVVTATCRPGSVVQLGAPWLTGAAALEGNAAVDGLAVGVTRAGVLGETAPLTLGVVPPSGQVTVAVTGSPSVLLPENPVGCLDLAARDARVAELSATAAEVTVSGHTLSASWGRPVEGQALVTVPRVPGWRCSTGGDWTSPGTAAGFLAVAMAGDQSLACAFRPPGLRLGLGVGALALAALTALGLRRRRRRPVVPHPATVAAGRTPHEDR